MNPKRPIETVSDVINQLVITDLEIAQHEAEIARLQGKRTVLMKIILPRYQEILNAETVEEPAP